MAHEIPTDGATLEAAIADLRHAPHRRLLLDYDGTLVPLCSRPELAHPPAALSGLLEALATIPNTEVHIVSGRPTRDLDRWLAKLPVHLHAEHGAWSKAPLGRWQLDERITVELEEDLVDVAIAVVARTPGAFVEVKRTGLAFHYRLVAPVLIDRLFRDIRSKVVPRMPPSLRWAGGSKVVELRPRIVHKGIVAAQVAASAPPGTAVFGAGDDHTDEELFAGLPETALTVKVGAGPSRAILRAASHAELVAALAHLCEP